MPPKAVVITGPTATGKTKLGVVLSKLIGGEVVSADSMQIYKHMDIGTAKPTVNETEGVPHHMIDVAEPFESYSVARYVEEASKCIDDILSRGKMPVIVGGTGLYIESLISGRSFAESGADTGLRREISELYDRIGGEEMKKRLAEFDPESAAKFHSNDKKRIVRAFEIYRATGKTASRHNVETMAIPPRYETCRIALNFLQRADLYARIDCRVDKMMKAGLTDEVKMLLSMGVPPFCTAMQAIGYKELVSAISGEESLMEAVHEIKTESRRYAKRQISWLGRDKELHWILWNREADFGVGVRDSTAFLEKTGII
ncbi:MAG: tRNA (adenosine(37)-N6)-dimethylallyltransferase MiaA [Oscillospiraceae bacterium]